MNESSGQSPWIVETTDATFEQDVVQRSNELPVVVDFWAEWCGPCRMLGPLLERLAAEYDGKFLLAKANTDLCPRAAMDFQVQSIPAVFALRGGQPVDYFVGLLPEPQLRQWLDRLQPSKAEQLVSEAIALQENDPATAEKKFRQAWSEEPDNCRPALALAELMLAQDRVDEARQVIGRLENRGFLEPEAERVHSIIVRRTAGKKAGTIEACRQAVAADPENLDLQLRLAEALAGQEQYEEALKLCLGVVQHDRQVLGEPARKIMVDIFRLLPEDSELTAEYRRKLSAALY